MITAKQLATTPRPIPVRTGPTLYFAPPLLKSLPFSKHPSTHIDKYGLGTTSVWTCWATIEPTTECFIKFLNCL